MRSRMSARGLQVMLVLAAAFIMWGCCDWCPPKNTEPVPKLRVALTHECVGAWIPFNNTFATSDEAKMWNGVLVQFGKYDDILEGFDSVELSLKGSPVKTLTKGQFRWLNVLPENAIPAPMDTSHVEGLMPPSGMPCSTVEECARTANCTADPNVDLRKCFRQEKIHMNLDVMAILTIWSRTGAYQVKAEAVSTDSLHPAGVMSYELLLDETMRIEAYDSSGDMLDGFPLAAGAVDLIKVTAKGGVDHGGVHSPPWPR